jgi:hypothetical protein
MLLGRASVILGLGCIVGCPMAPRYDDYHPAGKLIEPALASGFPQIGTTTRAEVLLTLGEPHEVSGDEASFTYRWSMLTHYLTFYGGAPIPVGGTSYFPTHHSLVIEFDSEGRVKGFSRTPPR